VRKPRIAAIGAGRLAKALLPALRAAGYPVVAVMAPSLASARALARRVGARAGTDPARTVEEADVVLLAVPDRRIEEAAAKLARGASVAGKIVLHHAGSLGIDPLRPLARRGAAVGVLHPFQVLSDAEAAASVLPGSFARIEGDPRAVAAARRIAADLGLVPFRPRRSLGLRARAAYHAAASLVSNDLVALLSLAADALVREGFERSQVVAALVSLARGTLAHAERGGLDSALTGPVARGDVATVTAQLRSLRRLGRGAAEAHRLLGRELLALALEGGRISRKEAVALRRVLRVESARPPRRRE
jgi:predicted short-subunit dehydrogenase-like oxidoreductase (DUF2520 family)